MNHELLASLERALIKWHEQNLDATWMPEVHWWPKHMAAHMANAAGAVVLALGDSKAEDES